MAPVRIGRSAPPHRSPAPRWAPRAACVALFAAVAPAARAQPITYEFRAVTGGTYQGQQFYGATAILTFTGANAGAPYSAFGYDGRPLQPSQHAFGGLQEFLTLTIGSQTLGGLVTDDATLFTQRFNPATPAAPTFAVAARGGVSSGSIYALRDNQSVPDDTYDLRTPFTGFVEIFPFDRVTVTPASLDGELTINGFAVDLFTATVAPEPSTWALVGTGLLAVGGAAVRRRRARS